MEEDIEIRNKEELNKQREEYILNGQYMRVQIIISKDENEPISTDINLHGVSVEEIAKMILCLDETKKHLEKHYPEASCMSKFMSIGGTIEEK